MALLAGAAQDEALAALLQEDPFLEIEAARIALNLANGCIDRARGFVASADGLRLRNALQTGMGIGIDLTVPPAAMPRRRSSTPPPRPTSTVPAPLATQPVAQQSKTTMANVLVMIGGGIVALAAWAAICYCLYMVVDFLWCCLVQAVPLSLQLGWEVVVAMSSACQMMASSFVYVIEVSAEVIVDSYEILRAASVATAVGFVDFVTDLSKAAFKVLFVDAIHVVTMAVASVGVLLCAACCALGGLLWLWCEFWTQLWGALWGATSSFWSVICDFEAACSALLEACIASLLKGGWVLIETIGSNIYDFAAAMASYCSSIHLTKGFVRAKTLYEMVYVGHLDYLIAIAIDVRLAILCISALFILWLIRRRRASKQNGSAPNPATCVVCLVAPVEATFVHGLSGHTVCCMNCAQAVRGAGGQCPICRQQVQAVIRNFLA